MQINGVFLLTLLMTENLENICFRDQAFINAYPLTEHNILDYFSGSQFYDASCMNEVLKMQTKYTNLEDLKNKLNEMTGLQYILHYYNEERTLFIIFQIYRHNSNDFDVNVAYYVMFGSIYQSPTNYSLYESRTCNFLYFINEVLDLLEENKEFDCFKGFSLKNNSNENKMQNVIDNREEREFFYKILQNFDLNKEI